MAETEKVADPGGGKKLKSKVWLHMERINTENKALTTAKCKYCKITLSAASSNDTSHLNRHRKKCGKRLNHDIKNYCLAKGTPGDPNLVLKTLKFDQDEIRKGVCVFVVAGAHPFIICEEPGFRYMVSLMCPQYNCMSRHTLKRDAMKIFVEERSTVMEELEKSPGRISLTTDNWKSENTQDEYICITAHWIDCEWKLQKRIIRFAALTPPFDGVSIADEISLCLSQWKIDQKVLSMTLDNAGYNNTMIASLKPRLNVVRSLLFGGEFFQIRCCCHIINLVVQSGIKLIDDVVSKIRGLAKHLKHSIPKRKRFYVLAEKSFRLNTKKRLRLDCCIRWNSTFLMLDRALYFKPVLDHWGQRDKDMKVFELSTEEWEKVFVLQKFLKVFYDVTTKFSSSKVPTSSIYFYGVWKIHMKLIEQAKGPHNFMVEMVKSMQQKFDKYWDDYNMMLSFAAVLDPRFKLERVEYCYGKIYGESYAKDLVLNINNNLSKLFEEYKPDLNSLASSSSSIVGEMGDADEDNLEDYAVFLSKKQKRDNTKSQLELYFEEKNVDHNLDLDILQYWKNASIRYPELASMARDILTIPISSVASESAFSMGKKLINPWRSSLSPSTIEAIACGEDWLRAKGISLGSSGLFATYLEEGKSDDEIDEEKDVDADSYA